MIGPRGILLHALEELGMTPLRGARVREPNGAVVDICMPAEPRPREAWKHLWRELIRQAVYRDLVARRPEFGGVERGIDKTLTTYLFRRTQHQQRKLHIAMTLTGAQLTQKILYAQGQVETACCPRCGHPDEDTWHMFWECPAFQDARDVWYPEVPYRLPRVLLTHGILPLGSQIVLQEVVRVQLYQLAISLLRLREEKGEGSVRLPIPEPHDWAATCAEPDVRRQRKEVPLELPREEPDQVELEQRVGEHVLRRPTATSLRCDACGVSYTLSHAFRFAYSRCMPDAPRRPTSVLPAQPTRVDALWKTPRHTGIVHDFVVDPGSKKISCTKCLAGWKWRHRHLLPRYPCLGSAHAERMRREMLAEELPLIRNGHAPTLAPGYCALQCGMCALQTPTESLRGFDRHVCEGSLRFYRAPGIVRNARRRVQFLCVQGTHGPMVNGVQSAGCANSNACGGRDVLAFASTIAMHDVAIGWNGPRAPSMAEPASQVLGAS